MSTFKITILAALLLCGATITKAQTADEIMERHITAIGGVDNWNKIKTLKMVGGLSQGGMDISITQTIAMGKAARTDISVMGMSGFQIVTTNEGWMYMPFMGAAKLDTMKPDMVKAMQKQLDVKGIQMLDYKTNGTKTEYTGKDTINKAACYKVKFTDKEGNESVSYFECATYYLVRSESKIKQNDQEQEVAVQYDNYKKLDEGIVMPMSVTAQGAEIIFKSIDVNKPVDDAIFIPTVPREKNKESDKK